MRAAVQLDMIKLSDIRKNINLKEFCYMRVGGTARYFYEAKNIAQLLNIVNFWTLNKERLGDLFVLGSGSNILFSDGKINKLVIKPNLNFIKRIGQNRLFVGCGVEMKKLLNFAVKNKLSGLEWSAGIPGTVGGAIRGNAGAFGGEIKDSVVGVLSVDIIGNFPKLFFRKRKECSFGYRTSVFKENQKKGGISIIIGVAIGLKKSRNFKNDKEKIRSILDYRKSKHPVDVPTMGSTFKNIPKNKLKRETLKIFSSKIKTDPFPILPIAVVIDRAGLKGKKIGGAGFSMKHTNFIVNYGRARSFDVLKLIKLAKKTIKNKFNIRVEEEIEVVK